MVSPTPDVEAFLVAAGHVRSGGKSVDFFDVQHLLGIACREPTVFLVPRDRGGNAGTCAPAACHAPSVV